MHEDNLPPKLVLLEKSDRAKRTVIKTDAFFIFSLSSVASSRRIVDEMMGDRIRNYITMRSHPADG
ncbi:hypothetical protein NDI39_17355 [Microcoleus sp. ZQ-A2]|nr:hypothetical protein [Microcoleus sp. FACHB-1]